MAVVGSLVVAGSAWALLALIHGDFSVRVVPVRRSAGADWWSTAIGLTLYPLVIGGGLATLAWWTYKFLRDRLRRRGPWG